MGDTLAVWIRTCISVVILASLVSIITWTIVIGSSLATEWENDVVSLYSEAGLSVMIDSHNVKDVDAANIYKMLEMNRTTITSYEIRNMDSSLVTDTRNLLNRPTDRFSVDIKGSSSSGFKVTIKQVK